MNKKLVRLTESDLHKIVKESVNQVLTELDWKTYMNAADKSYERGPMFQTYVNPNESPKRNERSRRFAKAAEDTLNRDFGYNRTYKSGNKGSLRFSTPHDRPDYQYDDDMGYTNNRRKVHFVADKTYPDGGRISDVGPRGGWGYDDHTYIEYPDKDSSWGYRLGDRVPKSDIYKGDAKFKDAINKGESEIRHYRNGDYEYQKGKGWELKH